MARDAGRVAGPGPTARIRRRRQIVCADRHPSGPAKRKDPPDYSPLMLKIPGVQATGRAEHNDRRVFLVFRRCHHLFLGQLERDAVALAGNSAETQCAPVDHDFPTADAEEAAEVDDRGAHRALAIDDHINDTSHVLVGCTANVTAEYPMRIARTDHGDRWRRRGLLRHILRALLVRLRWYGFVRRLGGDQPCQPDGQGDDKNAPPHIPLLNFTSDDARYTPHWA